MKDKGVIAFTAVASLGVLALMAAPALPGSQAAKDAVKPAAVKVEPTAEAKARLAKINAQSKAINDKNKAKREAADAKFKAEGWFQIERGIYGRWCTDTCSRAEVIGTASYWLLEVYCKERACGDIYAQLNISKGGTVVGWTNDTAYLGYGQKGILTFQKYGLGNGSAYQGSLVKFSARG
jgi:hypothetical protein